MQLGRQFLCLLPVDMSGKKIVVTGQKLSDTDTDVVLGGVWQDFRQQLQNMQKERDAAVDSLTLVVEERDRLLAERATMDSKFRDSIASLTAVESGHLEQQQIIRLIRKEQEQLSSRLLSSESQNEWLRAESKRMQQMLAVNDKELRELRDHKNELEKLLHTEKIESKTLQEIVYSRDEAIDSLSAEIENYQNDLSILNKSLSTKDRQWHVLLKERDRLRDELENSKRTVERKPLRLRSPGGVQSAGALVDSSAKENSTLLLSPDKTQEPLPEPAPKLSQVEKFEQKYVIVHQPEGKSSPYTDIFLELCGEGQQRKSGKTVEPIDTFDVRDRQQQAVIDRLRKELQRTRAELEDYKSKGKTIKTSLY